MARPSNRRAQVARLLEASAKKIRPSGYSLIAVGSAYALRAMVEELDGCEPLIRCEDPKTKPDQYIYKRLFVFVPDEHFNAAAERISRTRTPPHAYGLCNRHPNWTDPCPDCIDSPYDIAGNAYDYLSAQNDQARKWVKAQMRRGRFD